MAKKDFALLEYFEDLQQNESFLTRRMFGGLAIYYKGLFVAMLIEEPGDKTYRGKKYQFDIWDGVLIPTSREYHELLFKDFPDLVSHPVLGKWLYLPQQTENFEEILAKLIRLIRKQDPRLGIIPKEKKKKSSPQIKTPKNKKVPKTKKSILKAKKSSQ
jgi:hypothetical protein